MVLIYEGTPDRLDRHRSAEVNRVLRIFLHKSVLNGRITLRTVRRYALYLKCHIKRQIRDVSLLRKGVTTGNLKLHIEYVLVNVGMTVLTQNRGNAIPRDRNLRPALNTAPQRRRNVQYRTTIGGVIPSARHTTVDIRRNLSAVCRVTL